MTVHEPSTTDEVAALLARANRERLRVLVRGAGTKPAWGAASAPPIDITLSTTKLCRVLAHRHGDLTATIEAGASLAAVNRELATHGQWLPLDPPWADRATVGGLVATNDSGPRRHRYGAPRDLIIGVDVVRADGVAAKAGGIVVKNVAGYDLGRLMTGSFGSLAVIVGATFKLYPLPPASRTVIVEPYEAVLPQLLASQLTPTAVEVQAPVPRLLVRFETTDVAAQQQADAVGAMAKGSGAAAMVVGGCDEAALWTDHDRRPWALDGAVIKITLLPTAVQSTLRWLDETVRDDYDVIGRAGVGVLLARIGGAVERQARAVEGLRERLRAPMGSAVLVRGSNELTARVDPWGPMGNAFELMQEIKDRFDPLGILNPGRGPGGL